MPKNPLFSTYRQGENRVTSTMLAVFERIDLSILEAVLTAATGESALQFVSFVNQPKGTGASVPDAKIAASFGYWFEVKTVRDALDETQLFEHLRSLDPGARSERMFVVTPDASEPPAIAALGDRRVVWFNFRGLFDAMDSVLDDDTGMVSEHARFLLRELQALLVEDGLIDNDDVVIVAARFGYSEYLEHWAYICQPDRSFRDGLTHMGFYADGAIQPYIPKIVWHRDAVPMTYEEAERLRPLGTQETRAADLIEALISTGARIEGTENGIFLLTPPDDLETVRLPAPIANDSISATGRTVAWTMGQRYTSLGRLTRPGVTSTSQITAPT